MSRQAFEKWAGGSYLLAHNNGQYSSRDTQRAWEAWQAAQAQTLLEVIRDDSGCPTEVRIAEALQHAGQGEAARETLASWMLSRGFSTGYGESVTDLLAELGGQITQPAVPEVDEVVFDMLKAAQGACKLGLKGYANTYIQNAIDLLSAGKGGE